MVSEKNRKKLVGVVTLLSGNVTIERFLLI